MTAGVTRRGLGFLGRAALVVAGLVALGLAWEGYKAWAPADGVSVGGVRLLPRTNDAAMPHLSAVWDVLQEEQVATTGAISFGPRPTVLHGLVEACGHTLGWAAMGLLIGLVVGALLAVLMDALSLAERALLPYVVLSQTVPLIALTPMLSRWGNGWGLLGWHWTKVTSVEVIAAYLAFFPVAVGLLRGLKSPSVVHRDYFTVTAAGWWRTLVLLRLPAAVRHLVPALRLAAAAAVVGTIVAEISIGQPGGIGMRILDYSQVTGNSAKLYAAVAGAAVLGLLAAAAVTVVDLALWRYHRAGASS
ncbi:MAG TPA: ABC transporter permease subunit [Nocardioides sp.]|nr:ABC transporter permease subunit [Nocardioides sp.]